MPLVLALFFLCLSQLAFARDERQVGIGGALGKSFLINPSRLAVPAESGLAGGVWTKYAFSKNIDLELSYYRLDFSNIKTYTNEVSFGVLYFLKTDKKSNPYLHFGLGGGTIPHNGSDSDGQLELLSMIGAGLEYKFSKHWAASIQADFHAFFPTGKNNNQIYATAPLVGLTYFWGLTPAQSIASTTIVQSPIR